jgi:hypothetical protein
MEKQELEAVVRMMKAWSDAAYLGNYEALTSLSPLLTKAIAQLELPFDHLQSIVEKISQSKLVIYDLTSDRTRDLTKKWLGISHKVWSPFSHDNPERHEPYFFAVCYLQNPGLDLNMPTTERHRFVPESIHLVSDQSINEKIDEDTQATHLIQTAIKAIEKIRLAMKHDEQEISQIQANTQRLLEKIKAA